MLHVRPPVFSFFRIQLIVSLFMINSRQLNSSRTSMAYPPLISVRKDSGSRASLRANSFAGGTPAPARSLLQKIPWSPRHSNRFAAQRTPGYFSALCLIRFVICSEASREILSLPLSAWSVPASPCFPATESAQPHGHFRLLQAPARPPSEHPHPPAP